MTEVHSILPLLHVKDLSIDFVSGKEVTTAVKSVSFSLTRGEVVAIVGESGSGKTVTALSILKLLPMPPAIFRSGNILFSNDGISCDDLLLKDRASLRKIRGNSIAMIFQEPMSSLNPVFTCGHQIVEAIRAHKNISNTEAKKQATNWLDRVKLPGAAGIFSRYPHQLSGGQKQRVMIAMAMSCNPSLLICDEPTTALDVTVQKAILQLISELREESNIGVIFITHDLGVVGEIADRILTMYKGEIVEQNSVEQIFLYPRHPYTRALLACRPGAHRKGERLPVVSDFIGTVQKKSADRNPSNPIGKKTDKALEVNDLSVWFPVKKNFLGKPVEYLKAVDDVNFVVYAGETLGVVGESGCGKTTLGRALLRLIEPTAGEIIYEGQEISKFHRDQLIAIRNRMQFVFQDPYSSLNPRITIGAAIAEPMKVYRLYDNKSTIRDKVVDLLEKVDLAPEHFGRYPHEFSGGQRQRIVIARALALNPSFVVCDEPVSALDVSVQAQVLNLLNDLKQQFNLTIIFISHDLSVVRYMSDRVVVMNKGKIEETGSADVIYSQPQREYTKKLIASIPGRARFIP